MTWVLAGQHGGFALVVERKHWLGSNIITKEEVEFLNRDLVLVTIIKLILTVLLD